MFAAEVRKALQAPDLRERYLAHGMNPALQRRPESRRADEARARPLRLYRKKGEHQDRMIRLTLLREEGDPGRRRKGGGALFVCAASRERRPGFMLPLLEWS